MRPARSRGVKALAAATGGVLIALSLPATAAVAGDGHGHGHGHGDCRDNRNDTYRELLGCVTVSGVLDHMEAFQKIAENSDDPVYPGTRAAGTDGYDDSVRYVARKLKKAGYKGTLDSVEISFDFPALRQQLTPEEATYETGIFTGSGVGDVTGNVIPVDLSLEADRETADSGCEPADFAGLGFDGPDDIITWVLEYMKPEFDAIDEHFRQNQQRFYVRDL